MNKLMQFCLIFYGTLIYEGEKREQYRIEAYSKLVDYLKSLGCNISINYFMYITIFFEKFLKKVKGTLNEIDMIYVYWRILKNLTLIPH